MFRWIGKAFEEHKLARRGSLIWAITMITITIFAFLEMAEKMANADKVFIAIIGILATVIGFYQWHRQQDGDK